MFRISIARPCHASWKEMDPVQGGAYCSHCASTVIDFSGMTDRQLADYFSNAGAQPVCGRFLPGQLNRPVEIVSPDILLMDIPAWKKYLAILLICFSGILTGCAGEKEDDFCFPIPETQQANSSPKGSLAVPGQDKVLTGEKSDCPVFRIPEKEKSYLLGKISTYHYQVIQPELNGRDGAVEEKSGKDNK